MPFGHEMILGFYSNHAVNAYIIQNKEETK